MNKYKQLFPIFKHNPKLVYLDTAATSLKPQRVIDKEVEYYEKYSANVGRGLCPTAIRATEEFETAREVLAQFIGAKSKDEIVFSHGATEGINLVAQGWGGNNLETGDEIVLTEVEHHANLLPWLRLARGKGLKIKYVPVEANNLDLNWQGLDKLITNKTKILAFTQVSNVTGLVNQVEEIVRKVKIINPEILVVVDGAQGVGHLKVDVAKMGADFYVFSGHKMYGPTGVGVIYGKAQRWQETEPLMVGGGAVADVEGDFFELREIPHKFEAGTPPIAQVIGLREAVEFIKQIGWDELEKVEAELAGYTYKKLLAIRGITILGNSKSKIITFGIEGIHPHDVGDFMGRRGICVRAGHHCCLPLHKQRNLMATTRISFGVFNTKDDVDRAIEAISDLKQIYGSE